MLIPEPFTPVVLSGSILANLATDILKHHAQSLDDTLAGRMLKRAGLIEPNFEDRLRDTLVKSLQHYFETYPQYRLTAITAFFQDPDVARQIGGYILDRQVINQAQIEQALERHLGQDVTSLLLSQRELDLNRIIPDFLACYRQVLNQQLTIPQMSILLEVVELKGSLLEEIRASEVRLTALIETLMQKLSSEVLQATYQAEQQKLTRQMVGEMAGVGLVQLDQAMQTIEARLRPRPALFDNGLCRGQPLRPKPEQYFVAHSLSPNTLADWRQALTEALAYAGGTAQPLQPYFAGDALLGGFRLCAISEQICASRFSLFLLPPSQDRNVYLELGIAIGLGAPFFLIQHYQADIPPVLAGLGRYTQGGMFRRMRRELPNQVEEYDFGVVHFVADLPPAGSRSSYLVAPGEIIEDEDFEASLTKTIGRAYPHLTAVSLSDPANIGQAGWALDRLVETIQTARFTIYRVDKNCSPITFLALGLSIGLNRPFLMTHRAGQDVPEDIRGITLYQFPNFVTLSREFIARHQPFFDRYAS